MSVLDVNTASDDVEDVMRAVGDAVSSWERQAAPSGAGPQRQDNSDDLRRRAALLRHQWRVDSNAIIHSNRPGLGPWLIRMQSLIRRMSWWFLEPVVQQIRLYQRNSARVIDGLAREQEQVADKLSAFEGLSRHVADLEARLVQLENRRDELGSYEDHAS